MNTASLNVVVAGAAIGGSAAALLLARAGAKVTVFEKVAEPRAVGAGIGLVENGLAVLESLGLGPALRPFLRPLQSGRIVNAQGRVLLETGTPAVSMIRRSTLQTILLDAVEAEPTITLHCGAKVVDANPDGSIRARTARGMLDIQADLIIGADGVHSTIRECGSFGMRVNRDGMLYMRTLVQPGLARNEEAWTSAGLFGSFEVDDATYVFASAGSDACIDAVEAQDLDRFRRIWSRAYPPSAELLADIAHWDELLFHRVYRVECRRWVDGAMILLGDAAHAMPPNLGQGGNSAFVDAAVLLDELRKAPNLPAALASWQHRRLHAVRMVASASAAMGRIAEWTHPYLRGMRDRVMLPVSQKFFSTRSSAMILQERPDALLAIGRT